MKFCSKCGHELIDEAVVCTNCGCTVDSSYQAPINAPSVDTTEAQKEKSSVLPVVFNFAFAITAVLSVFFLFLSLAFSWVSTSGLSTSSETVDVSVYFYSHNVFASPHTHNVFGSVYLYTDGMFAILGLISAIASCGFGVVSFVLTLVKKEKLDKLFSSITRLFIGVALIVLSICIGLQGW